MDKKWIVKGAPQAWTDPAKVLEWCIARGFQAVQGVGRTGHNIWHFRGKMPTACVNETSIKFSNYICVYLDAPGEGKGKSN